MVNYGVYELFPGFKFIQNPLIDGITLDKSDEIILDSNKNEYLLKIILSKKNIEKALEDTLLEGAYKIQYEYLVSRKEYKILKAIKLVQTDKGDLYSSLEFKTKYLKEKKFNKTLRKFFKKSFFTNLDEIIEERRKINYPQDSTIHFNIKTIDGKMIGTQNDSTRIFVLDFWFAACGPCRMAMPYLDSLHQKYKDQGVMVLGLNWMDKDTAEIHKVLHQRNATYPNSMEALELARKLKINTYPYLIILNQDRKILFAESGFTKDKMKEIDELIAKELKK